MEKKDKDIVIPFSRKNVPIRDFIYLCIILVIATISIISMVLSDSTRAGENLNFAATVVSIVLAILAIVITLTDSSGQKENIRKLEEAVDKMEISVGKTQQILSQTFDKSEEHIKTLITLKDELKNHYEESIEQLKDNIYSVIEGENNNITKDDIDKIFEKSFNELKENLSKNKKYTDFDSNLNDIAAYIVDKYMHYNRDYLTKSEFEEFLLHSLLELGFDNNYLIKVRVKKLFNHLINNDQIYYVDNEGGYSTVPF